MISWPGRLQAIPTPSTMSGSSWPKSPRARRRRMSDDPAEDGPESIGESSEATAAIHRQRQEARRREVKAWELNARGWSQRRIARDLGCTQGAVSKMLRRTEGRILEQL